VTQPVATPPDGSDAGRVIRWHRQHAGMTQHEAAVVLNTTQSRLSKIETGVLLLGIDELRFIAGKLNIPSEQLGILPDRPVDAIPQPEPASGSPGAVLASQERWRMVRAELNANLTLLGDLAAELYPRAHHMSGSSALTQPDWLPATPVEIGDIGLYEVAEPARPVITGGIEQTESARPLAADGTRYGALLARPT